MSSNFSDWTVSFCSFFELPHIWVLPQAVYHAGWCSHEKTLKECPEISLIGQCPSAHPLNSHKYGSSPKQYSHAGWCSHEESLKEYPQISLIGQCPSAHLLNCHMYGSFFKQYSYVGWCSHEESLKECPKISLTGQSFCSSLELPPVWVLPKTV